MLLSPLFMVHVISLCPWIEVVSIWHREKLNVVQQINVKAYVRTWGFCHFQWKLSYLSPITQVKLKNNYNFTSFFTLIFKWHNVSFIDKLFQPIKLYNLKSYWHLTVSNKNNWHVSVSLYYYPKFNF